MSSISKRRFLSGIAITAAGSLSASASSSKAHSNSAASQDAASGYARVK